MTKTSYQNSILLTKAYRILRVRAYACLTQYNLTSTMWSLLGIVSDAKDGVRLARVAKSIGVKAPMVTMLADELTKRGVITRVQNPVDARAKLLIMTPVGKALVKTIEAALREAFGPLLEGVTEKDMEIYQKVLEIIIKNEHTT